MKETIQEYFFYPAEPGAALVPRPERLPELEAWLQETYPLGVVFTEWQCPTCARHHNPPGGDPKCVGCGARLFDQP